MNCLKCGASMREEKDRFICVAGHSLWKEDKPDLESPLYKRMREALNEGGDFNIVFCTVCGTGMRRGDHCPRCARVRPEKCIICKEVLLTKTNKAKLYCAECKLVIMSERSRRQRGVYKARKGGGLSGRKEEK